MNKETPQRIGTENGRKEVTCEYFTKHTFVLRFE